MSCTQSVLPLLLEAAFADSHFKVVGKIYERKKTRWLDSTTPQDEHLEPAEYSDKHRYDRNHPYYRACDDARELAEKLGRFCRQNNIDLSTSPMVTILKFKDTFSEAYEKNRVVHVDALTPKVLHDCVEKRNVLHWNGWTIKAGKLDECDDDYGLPNFVRPLIAKHNAGEPAIELWMPGLSTKRAREAFALITGSVFSGDDGLEADLPHMYEHMFGY